MTRNLLYIINPISGTGGRLALNDLVADRTRKAGFDHVIFPSVAGGDYSFLHPIIREKKITDVIIAGGDGTISQVVASLMKLDVNFGIIPCGSGNGLAYTLKIPKNPIKALECVFTGNTDLIDGFYINGQFACMLGGVGFDAKVAHDFAAEPKRGLATYIRLSLKNFFSMRPFPFLITIDKFRLPIEAYFISVANSNQFGNNFRIAPRASLSDGLLDIVILTKQNKISFMLETMKQFAGWSPLQALATVKEKRGIIYFQTEKITIQNPKMAPLHVDGEPIEPSGNIDIKVIKHCFRVIHP